MKHFSFRSPLFWTAFFLLSILGAGWSYRYFPVAFPLVTLDLSMNRSGALSAAEGLAREHSWVPESYDSTASFGVESRVQAFIELEAGGAERFREVLAGGPYSPYSWQVRLFQPGETLEARLRFRPDGSPYALRIALPEDLAGPALDAEAARSIAESACTSPWAIDLSDWEAIETASELLPSGRRDHLFVYRHRHLEMVEMGEGELRLRLGVGGDRLTELTPFVWLPDAFDRRYEKMRSANRAVSGAAGFAIAVLYLLGGCLGGLFWLARKRGVEARPAWIWGFSLAFLQVLADINEWPLLWMTYDTALSPLNHALWEALGLVVELVGLGFLFTLTFMAAEGLGRRAFPDHHQFWKSWAKGVGNSPGILGQTLGGYLLVAAFFAYEVALYVLAHRHLGWWTPSDALLHPDVLATYLPWLGSIAVSIQAGFWEECLFRAVPLAGAALLGRRFGRRRLFIVLALVLQALIFGAAHANYATQPAWARLVELSLPALGFGLLYLRFGLLATIVLHYAFDVVWFALPLFVSDAPGLWDDRLLVVLSTLLPLAAVFYRRLQAGSWQGIPPAFRNRAWSPPPPPQHLEPFAAPARPLLRQRPRRAALLAGLVGLFGWIVLFDKQSDAPRLAVTRSTAVAEASRILEDKGIELAGEGWRALASPLGEVSDRHRFVWDEAGEATYEDLLGTYLSLPGWQVRWARFDGDVVDRSEEVHVVLGPGGELRRLVHSLPEAAPGASLEEDQAAEIAREAVRSMFGIDVDRLEEVARSSEQLPARRDWKVTWSDPSVTLGESRVEVVIEIAGDEVVDAYRRIDLPESWQRKRRDARSLTSAFQVIAWLVFTLAIVTGVVYGVVRWSRRPVSIRELLTWAALLATLGLLELAGSWPSLEAGFSTAQSYLLQATLAIGSRSLTLLVTALGMGLLAALLRSWWPKSAVFGPSRPLLGLAGAATAAFAASALGSQLGRYEPLWPAIGNAGQLLPILAAAIGPLLLYLQITLLAVLLVLILDRLSAAGRRRSAMMLGASLAFGLTLGGLAGIERVGPWLGEGLVVGLLFFFGHRWLFRYDLGLVPWTAAGLFALSSLGEAIAAPYPGARLGSVLAVVLVLVAGWIWSQRWGGEQGGSSS